MIWPIYQLYCFCVGFDQIYKWAEFQILKPFKPLLKRKGKELGESIGVIYHCPGDPEWTQFDNDRVHSTCTRYEKIIHVKVNNDIKFVRIANTGSLGSAQSYMAKEWECENEEDLAEIVKRTLENGLMTLYYHPWNRFLEWVELYAFNLGSRKRAFQIGKKHYDLGNEHYETMLDTWMQYTCGYWKDANDLETAQLQKMELIAKKLDLKPGMRVLDIGCGWGTLCKYLAEKYKVECVGVTVSQEGVDYARELCKGLPVDIRLQDYRDVNETFDRVVSIGMFEHVGFWNYREYFKVVRNCLVDDGIFLLHTIGRNHYSYPQRSDSFVHKYIFPNGNLPSPEDITKETKDLFVIEDWHNFGQDYTRTLHAWRANFLNGWDKLQDKYDERFKRMWIFYLCIAKGLFASRRLQLWQVVLSKNGLEREYRAAQ